MEPLVRLPADLLSAPSERAPGALVVGVDGGATKTLAAAWEPAKSSITLGLAGPSNPDAVGPSRAAQALHEAVKEAAGERASDEIAAAVFAIAGTDTEEVGDLVASRFDYAKTHTVNDVVAAWAAATDCQPGVAAIAGTGSNVLGIGERDQIWRAGGWGHILGDEGSGYWLGLEGIKAALHVRDGVGEDTSLFADATAHFDVETVEELAALVYGKPLTKGEIATFSRKVAARGEEGDAVATALLARAGRDLARQVCTVVERSGVDRADGFVVGEVGSTWQAGPLFTGPFEEVVRERAPNASFKVVSEPPVYGSLLLAGRVAGVWTDEPPRDLLDLIARAEGT